MVNSFIQSGNSNKGDLNYELNSVENIPVQIWVNANAAAQNVARSIASLIKQKQEQGETAVLGLATGSTPIKVYNELVRMHREEGLSFKNVVSFNLDEYYPMPPSAQQSYVRFMNEYLFNHIDIPKENINIPDGTIPLDKIAAYCAAYEQKIDSYGGIDIQLLGIGRTGHIGFNEPGSRKDSITRFVSLDPLTRQDAIGDFISENRVPRRAITMGIATIFKARCIYLMAWGEHKASIIARAVEGEVDPMVPSSYLQDHPNVKVVVDQEASGSLTRVCKPWLVGICNWDDDLICKAVTWLSQKLDKPILKLTDEDYNENHLGDLTVEYDSAYDINIKIFNRIQHTITGWPGGKPNADDTYRPERALPAKKRVVIFSPHPDDDVISMGGTFQRLVNQGHEVHVAYQTSGNIAVHDHDAQRFLEFFQEFGQHYMGLNEKGADVIEKVKEFFENKQTNQVDIPEVRNIKGYIRRGEARTGARFSGLPDKQIHFLDLPFYETGKSRKNSMGPADVNIVKDLLLSIQPHQVYAAGDLADPHGTHRVCLDIIFNAFKELEGESWMKDCWLWLYRGAWHEWAVDEIEMAVPLSPQEVINKRKAIFMHQSQKDSAPFPGDDKREFWQRAEDRNRTTAQIYRSLGLAEYEAMEAFVRWRF